MLDNNVTEEAIETAELVASASIRLAECIDKFKNIQTEEEYFYCCNIHSALKEIIHKSDSQKNLILSELAGEMFTYLFQYEQS